MFDVLNNFERSLSDIYRSIERCHPQKIIVDVYMSFT